MQRGGGMTGGAAASAAPFGVIVDAYSTGAALAPRFAEAGVRTLHVQSRPQPPIFYERSFHPEHFAGTIVHDGDLDATLAALARHEIAFVLAGAETGVPLADALAERLGLPGNGSALSHARRDKHAMAEAVRAAGLNAVAQLRTGAVEEAVAWASARGDWPVVVKPLDSAGTEGVFFCEDADEVEAAFAATLGRPNALGGANAELLVQELLRGPQVFTDSISWAGVHHVSETWRSTKRLVHGTCDMYDFEDLLEPRGAEQDMVAAYVRGVLDALGIRYGSAHTELVLTERGPVLIECGARMQGTILDRVVDRCTPSHVTVTVDAYLDSASVARRAANPPPLREHARVVTLISQHEGRIVAVRHDELERLPSYAGAVAMLAPGDRIARTFDLFTSPGTVYLVHADEARLREDYARLRELEQTGRLFEVEELVGS
jgi:biotin carboxylase